MPTNEAGTTLTCSNADCGCQLRIETPCPHGDTYTCACGAPFEATGGVDLRDEQSRRTVEELQDNEQVGGITPS